MIPKLIHYIWLGKKPEPKILKKCKKSWKKYCKGYEIKRWDESNLNLNINTYVKEAYEAKKYAFASDFLRFDILYKEGGIYLDIDVELIKPIDKFLDDNFFTGFESEELVNPGLIMGVEKNNPVIKNFIECYEGRHFIVNGEFDVTTICETVTKELIKHGLILNNTKQVIEGCHIYPTQVFCPIKYGTFEKNLTKETVSIHHYNESWKEKEKSLKGRIKRMLRLVLGKRNYEVLKNKFLKKE